MIVDLNVLSPENLTASMISGLLAGLWLAAFHPPIYGVGQVRRSVLQAWFFALPATILYAARISLGAGDGPRLVAAWLLWLLFAAAVGLGAFLANRARLWWSRRRGS